jgi:type II secretory ATPase GspE/PulE/Tfp pilus assembly ATPase PilB-like protein
VALPLRALTITTIRPPIGPSRRDTIETVAESPVVKLVNAILLAAVKKGAREVAIHAAAEGDCVVELIAGDIVHEEMRPQRSLLAPLVRRLAIMAHLPTYPKGMGAEGTIHLIIGDDRHAHFALYVEGHGDDMTASLRLLDQSSWSSSPS